MADGRLDRDAAERILRRAVELGDLPGDEGDAYDLEVLVAAARDLGVPTTAVHRAVAEEEAGLLGGEPGALDRLVGPAAVSAARVVPFAGSGAMALVDDWLRRPWAFKRVRSTGDVAEYRRRTDMLAGVQRSARSLTGKENADKVRAVRVLVRELDARASIVALVVDVSASRTFAEAGGSFVAGSGALMSVVSALSWAPWAWLGIPASAAAGMGVMATRNAWTRGIDLELEGLLDRVEAGDRPPGMLAGLTDRFLAGPAAPEPNGGERAGGSTDADQQGPAREAGG